MTDFVPFADGEASLGLDGLTVENGPDRIAVYGSLDIARDAAGLAAARRLRDLFAAVAERIEAGPPAATAAVEKPETVDNPFA